MRFSASFDLHAILFTTGAIVVFLVLLIWHYATRRKLKNSLLFWMRFVLMSIIFLAAIYCYAIHPKGYEVKRDMLIIKRGWNDLKIPTNLILDCRQIADNEMAGTTRILGVGGLFGYSGTYHNAMIGEMKFYATRFNNLVLIHTKRGEALILSPDKPKEMVEEIVSDITINN